MDELQIQEGSTLCQTHLRKSVTQLESLQIVADKSLEKIFGQISCLRNLGLAESPGNLDRCVQAERSEGGLKEPMLEGSQHHRTII